MLFERKRKKFPQFCILHSAFCIQNLPNKIQKKELNQ